MRKNIRCLNPNCRARYLALLRDKAPPVAPLCVECDMPLPQRVEGEFVYFVFAPPPLN